MKTEQEQVEELTQFMLEASNSANVEPVFECENGEKICLNSGATSILNDILEQAFIPYLAQKLVNAGYGNIKQAQVDVLKRLKVFSEPYPNSWGIYVIDVYNIDELIKEIEND